MANPVPALADPNTKPANPVGNDDFLARLEAEFPPSVLIDSKLGLYAWRFDDDAMAKIVAMSAAIIPQTAALATGNDAASNAANAESAIDPKSMLMVNEALALSLGDIAGPRCNTERGRRFISRTPLATRMEWANIIFDHCEINGPNAERKKK
jgi:hypothetical protein